MRLVERQTQLEVLLEYAREADAGHGRLVLVAGEAGVGKTSLLEQLEATIDEAHWFWGGCDGLFTPRPLAPVFDISGQLGGELAALSRAQTPRGDLFTAFLDELRGDHGLRVFVIEDVHWADEATLDLLRFVGRRMRDARALLLVTYRDDGIAANDPLRIALGELSTQRTMRRLSLPTLTRHAVATLAEGTGLDPALLHDLTGGNPFYLTEILQQGVTTLPTSVRDAVLSHVAKLSAGARDALDIAALIGSRIDPGLLLAVTGESHSSVDELVRSGILVADAGRLRFRHEIARLAVEQGIGVQRRAPLHRTILDALLQGDCDDDARLAFHAEGAGDAVLVLRHAPCAAARASALSSHRESVAQYERALRFADSADDRTRAELYDALAYQTSLVDRWHDSASAAETALALWRKLGDPLREGDTLGRLSRTRWRLCQGAESAQAADQALAVLEPLGPTAELARALVNAAGRHMLDSDPVPAISLARRGQVLGDRLGLADVSSDALNTQACATAELGGDWRPMLDQALEIAVTNDIPELAGRAYANSHAMLCALLDFPTAERYYIDGVAYCDEHDISTFGTCLRGERASTLDKLGRWDEAMPLAATLLDHAASPVNRLNPLITLGRLRARRDDPKAWETLDDAAAAATTLGEPAWTVLVRLARAEARWLQGELAAGREEIGLATFAGRHSDTFARSEIAAWRVRLGEEPGPGDDLVEPWASQIRGDHLGAARRWDELGCSYFAALALLDAGDAVSLRDAVTRLDGLGATAAARLGRKKMRALGYGSIPTGLRSSTRQSPAGLTRREREVLELICDGHTNGEISDRLYISVKTVDHHVSAVLGKLGVPTRKVAAAEAVRLGLVAART